VLTLRRENRRGKRERNGTGGGGVNRVVKRQEVLGLHDALAFHEVSAGRGRGEKGLTGGLQRKAQGAKESISYY